MKFLASKKCRKILQKRDLFIIVFVYMILKIFLVLTISFSLHAQEIAFTFDDAPAEDTVNFKSMDRAKLLVKKLTALSIPKVMIFANPCKGKYEATQAHLALYLKAGHLIQNHTCSHPRLDNVGAEAFIANIKEGDEKLATLMSGQKFLRYPYLNEGSKGNNRDQVRDWLKKNNYRNGMVSADNDDYIFSFKMEQAQKKGLKINHDLLSKLFVAHVVEGAVFYDELAKSVLGRSPKHVLLLHERDATVMYLEKLVAEFKRRGWKIISSEEAFLDPIYQEQPVNTYAGNGIIAQVAREKNGNTVAYGDFDKLKKDIDSILGRK